MAQHAASRLRHDIPKRSRKDFSFCNLFQNEATRPSQTRGEVTPVNRLRFCALSAAVCSCYSGLDDTLVETFTSS